MNGRFAICVGIPVIVAAATATLSVMSAQQTPSRRTTSGTPDISGVWQSGGVSLYGDQGTAGPPAGAREPPQYTAAYAAKQKTFTAVDDPTAACLLPGVPRITSMPMPFEIVQTPKKIVILYESFHAFRIIPIDPQLRHPDDVTPTWMGDSVAKWEGDSLVVDVIGFNDKTWLGGVGTVHSEDMHVVERFTPKPDGTLAYEATVTDPKALTKPWVTGATLRTPKDARVEEYECIENNQDLAHMRKP
ncbi:MAG TPA: hypothetical protein VFP91_13515 [Vicinamibacterales bacterium]|nr:hypothetical protein [Vicinamibacterales bacterium]